MAYQSIGRGSAANDGTGDDLRTGAGKVNANFVEIYTYLGDGSTLSSDAVVTTTATQTLTNKTITGTFTGNVTGNADTATALATARTIAGQSFDGSANITIAATDLSDTDQALATTGAVQFTGITSLGDNASAVGSIVLNCETNAHGQTIKSQPHSATVTNVLTLPAGSDQEIVGTLATQTLTNKTVNLTDNTVTGTTAEFNTALSDGDFATLAGTETLTNKTLTSPTVTGIDAFTGSQQALSGPGGVNLTDLITEVTTTGTGDALTLADGTAGQVKIITYVAEGAGTDTAILTPTTFASGSTITFNNLGEGVTLVYGTGGWTVIGVNGAAIA